MDYPAPISDCGLACEDQPHLLGGKADVHLQKVVAGARYMKLDEVEDDAASRG